MPRFADTNPYLPPTEDEQQARIVREIVDTQTDEQVRTGLTALRPSTANDTPTNITLSTSAEELALREQLTDLQAEAAAISFTVAPLVDAGVFTIEEIGRTVTDAVNSFAQDLNDIPVDIATHLLDVPGMERFVNRYSGEPIISAGALGISEELLTEYYSITDESIAAAFPEQFPPPGRSVTRRMAERAYLPQLYEPPQTSVGRVGSSMLEFTMAIMLAGNVARGIIGAGAATETAATRTFEMVGSLLLINEPAEHSLLEVFKQVPGLEQPVQAFLDATDDDAPAALRRVRQALEGAAIAKTFEPFIKGLEFYRPWRAAQRASSKELLKQLGRKRAAEAGTRAETGFAEATAAERTGSAAAIEAERAAALAEGIPRGAKVATPKGSAAELEAQFQRRTREAMARPAAARLGEATLDARKNLVAVTNAAGETISFDIETLSAFDKNLQAIFAASRESFRATTTDIEIGKRAARITTRDLLLKLDPHAPEFSINAAQARALRMRMQSLDNDIHSLLKLLGPEAQKTEGLTDIALAELFRLSQLRLAFEARSQRGLSEAARVMREAQLDVDAAVQLFTAANRRAQAEGFSSALHKRIVAKQAAASASDINAARRTIQQAGGREKIREMLATFEAVGDEDAKQYAFWQGLSIAQKFGATARFAFYQSTLSGLAVPKAAIGNTVFSTQLGIERSLGTLLPAKGPTAASPEMLTFIGTMEYYKGLASGIRNNFSLVVDTFTTREFQEVVGQSRLGGQRTMITNQAGTVTSRGVQPMRAYAGRLKQSSNPFTQRLGRAMSTLAFAFESPTRALVALDDLTGAAVTHATLRAQGADRAAMLGLRGNQFRTFVLDSVLNPAANDQAMALYRGSQAGLRQTPDVAFIQNALRFADSNIALNLMFPYMRPQLNQFLIAMERTPFALLSGNIRAEIAKGGSAAQMAEAKILLGSAIAMAFWDLAQEGRLFGNWPNVSGLTTGTGSQTANDHTIILGDTPIAYLADNPITKLMELTADAYHHGQALDPQSDSAQELIGSIMGIAVQIASSQVDLQGAASIISTARQGDISATGAVSQQELREILQGMIVPSGARAVFGQALAEDEGRIRKLPANMVERIDQAFGGFFGPAMAFAHVDLSGQSIPSIPGYMGLTFASVSFSMAQGKDIAPWANELMRLTLQLGYEPIKHPNPTIAERVPATPEEIWTMRTLAGTGFDGSPSFPEIVNELIAQPEYLAAPPFAQAALISTHISPLRTAARKETIRRMNDKYPPGHPLNPIDRMEAQILIATGEVPDFPRDPGPTNLESAQRILQRGRDRLTPPVIP